MRWSLMSVIFAGLVLVGCRSHDKEPAGGGGSNTEAAANENKETDPPANEGNEPAVEPGEDEVCLLPPEPLEADLAGTIKVGDEAPDFVIGKDADGKDVTLGSYRGKTVLLFFWATWCPYCKISLRQRGSMNSLGVEVNETEDSQLVIVGVGTGIDDSGAGQQAFVNTNEVPFRTLHDGDGKISEAYGVLGMPTCIVVGREGKVLTYGFYRKDSYQQPLLEYLKQECVSKPASK